MAKIKNNKPDDDDDLTDVLEDVLDILNNLPFVIGNLTDTMRRLTAGVSPLITALTNLFSIFSGTRTVPTTQPTPSSPTPSPGKAGGGAPGAVDPSSAMFKIGAVAGVAAAALAALAVTTALVEQKFRQIEQNVRMFNPGVIALFQQALDNLSATIGSAFVPMFQVATEVVRQWTRVLAPIMQQLAPMVRQFSEAFGNILVSMLTRLGSIFQTLLPSIAQLAEFFKLLAEVTNTVIAVLTPIIRAFLILGRLFYEMTGMGIVVRILTRMFEALSETLRIVDEALSIVEVVINTLVDAVMAFFESIFPIRKAMEGLRSAVDFVIRKMYVFAVMLAKLAGMDNVVDALIAHVEGKLKPGATAAQQPQIKSLDQLTKDLALAAASAGGAAGPGGIRNEQEFWAKTLEEMRLAKLNGQSITDILIEIKKAVLKLIPDAPKPADVVGAAANAVGAGGLVPGALGIRAGRAIAGVARGSR